MDTIQIGNWGSITPMLLQGFASWVNLLNSPYSKRKSRAFFNGLSRNRGYANIDAGFPLYEQCRRPLVERWLQSKKILVNGNPDDYEEYEGLEALYDSEGIF